MCAIDYNRFLFSINTVSGIPIFRTSKGNETGWFKKLDSSRNRGKNYSVRRRRGSYVQD